MPAKNAWPRDGSPRDGSAPKSHYRGELRAIWRRNKGISRHDGPNRQSAQFEARSPLVPCHQFLWEKSSSYVFSTSIHIDLKFNAISEFDKWWWSYTQRTV